MIRLLLSLIALSAISRADEDGFVPLFNGRDLSGWVNVNCAPQTWTVQDGMIHCDGVPTGALRTEKQYENFILELEWRHLKPRGNAGVFLWAGPVSSTGVPFLRAIEVQVLDHGYGQSDSHTTHGDVFPIHGSIMKPFGRFKGQRSFPSEERSKGSPEWNHYRITCQDGTLRLAVNGKDVSGGEDCTWRKGYIALESEGGIVDWKNLRLKELPGGKATPEQSAPAWDGSVSLYDGRSLNGWTASADAAGQWKATDWQLSGDGKVGTLTLDKKPGDFRLQFDVRTDSRGAADGKLPVCVNGQALPGSVTGTWTRYVVVRNGTRLSCNVEGGDGAPIPGAPITVATGPATISLNLGAPVKLAGIYLKETEGGK